MVVARTPGSAKGGEDGLDGGVGGGAGAFFSIDGSGEGLQGVELSGLLEATERFFFVLEVDPSYHVGHGGSGGGGGEQERGKELLGDGVPEVRVLEPASFSCPDGGGKPGGHAESALPVSCGVEG